MLSIKHINPQNNNVLLKKVSIAVLNGKILLNIKTSENQDLTCWKGGGIEWLAPTFDMYFINFTEDLSHSVIYHHEA